MLGSSGRKAGARPHIKACWPTSAGTTLSTGGARVFRASLRPAERAVSRGRIERLMRRHGSRAMTHRRFRAATTDSNHGLPIAGNLLDQRFLASRPNEIWLADITCIPTDEGWLYPTALVASRR